MNLNKTGNRLPNTKREVFGPQKPTQKTNAKPQKLFGRLGRLIFSLPETPTQKSAALFDGMMWVWESSHFFGGSSHT